MSKKLKALLLASVLCLSSLVSCVAPNTASSGSDSDSDGADNGGITETIPQGEVGGILEDGKTLMNGFEYFDRDIQLLRVFNDFGVLNDNTDKQYIRTGEHSLKINPVGSRVHSANPYFLISSSSLRFEEVAFGDFSKVDTVSFWFYNSEEEAVNVGIGFGTGSLFTSGADKRDHIYKTNSEFFTLQNGWNYIEYNVEPAYLQLQGLNINEVYGITVEFDYLTSHKLADSPTVYLDDVCLSYTDTPKSQELAIEVKTGTTAEGNPYWSIADFEDPLEAYYFAYKYGPEAALPVIRTVFAGDYNAITSRGTQALLIQKKHGGDTYGWPRVTLNEKVMKAVFAEIGDDILQNPDNYVFKLDVYNASNVIRNAFTIQFDGATSDGWAGGDPGTWATYSTTLGRIDGKKKTEIPYTQSQGTITFTWDRYPTASDLSDRPILVDNVRIEKIMQAEE